MPDLARAVVLAIAAATATASAAAPPRYPRPSRPTPPPPALVEAEAAWTAASAERDPQAATALWRAAARAFDRVAADEQHPVAIRRDAAYAALLSWKNALAVDPAIRRADLADDDVDPPAVPPPRAFSADEGDLVASMNRYLLLAPPSDPELTPIRFLRGNLHRRAHQHDAALADFTHILDHDPLHEVGAFAANLLLDTLIVTHRHDELIAWVRRLRADAAFLRAHDDLAPRLLQIERQWLRRQAEAHEATARRDHDLDAYDACGAAYDRVLALDPTAHGADEVLYNAGVCFESAGSADEALARYQRLLDAHPRGILAARALARTAALLHRTARFAEAADRYTTYARTYAGEKDAYHALGDAIHLRLALGDHAGAAADAQHFTRMFGARRRDDATRAVAATIAARLDAPAPGARRPARVLAAARRDLTALLRANTDRDLDAALAMLAWNAACPVVPTDGLCLRAPRTATTARTAIPRDPALARAALHRFDRLDTPPARLARADAALEAALALPVPPRPTPASRTKLTTATALARAAYDRVLTANPSPSATAHAQARLGLLALHEHALLSATATDRTAHLLAARTSFTTCADLAVAAGLPDLLRRCDAGLRLAGTPPPPLDERRPAASRPLPPPAAEPLPAR